MSEMCQHGYVPGTCPKGCGSTADDAEALDPPSAPYIEDKLKCVICGTNVERGIVYKGRPLCGNCMNDLKGKKEVPGIIGGYTKELDEKGEK